MNTHSIYEPALTPHLIVQGLNRYQDEPCLFLGDVVATYAEVRKRTSQYIQALHSRELGVGSRVAVLSGNRPEVLYNIAALQISGCSVTPLHPLSSVDDHVYMLKDAGIEALIYDADQFDDRARALREQVPGLKHLLAFGPTGVGEDYLALMSQFPPQPLKAAQISMNDISSISYTGGTTGKPKGVVHTHRGAAFMTMIQMAEWEWPDELRMLIATPLSHAAGALFVPTVLKGGSLYALPKFDANAVFDAIEKHKITATMLVPVMIYALLDSPRATTADMSSMETIFYGASPINPPRLKEGIEKWGQIFYQFYGQSEALMVLANMKKSEHDLGKPQRLSSCGRPTPWIHLQLLDSNNQPVAPGEAGEICVRAPLVMQEYLNLPEQTAEVKNGDWLHTGDVGRLDEEGFLYIIDRTKDMIVTGGFNVFPREVEDVIATNPVVAQVAVIGVPSQQWGEEVKAVIVLKPGIACSDALTVQIQQQVRSAKGSVQVPKSIDYVASIPLTAVGKPDKKALRAAYWKGESRLIG